MPERFTVVTLSVTLSVYHFFYFGEGSVFRVKLHQYNLGEDLSSLKNITLFENRSYLEKKRVELRL